VEFLRSPPSAPFTIGFSFLSTRPIFFRWKSPCDGPDSIFPRNRANPSRENISSKRKKIRSVGHLIRQFHEAGFFHGDLQLKNILAAGDQLLLIDFDRSYRKSALSTRERMKNLLRLNRSAEKWRRLGLPVTRTDRWRFFLAYAGATKRSGRQWERSFEVIRFGFYSIDLAGRSKRSPAVRCPGLGEIRVNVWG